MKELKDKASLVPNNSIVTTTALTTIGNMQKYNEDIYVTPNGYKTQETVLSESH